MAIAMLLTVIIFSVSLTNASIYDIIYKEVLRLFKIHPNNHTFRFLEYNLYKEDLLWQNLNRHSEAISGRF